jgi:MFS family permease
MAIPATLMPLMPTPTLMAALLFPIKFLGGFSPVLIPSAIQLVCPANSRAQMGALFMFTVGIIGVSLGPLVPALLSDYVFRDEGALRYSLAVTAMVVAPTAWAILQWGSREYRQRLLEQP